MNQWLLKHYVLKIKRSPKVSGAQFYILGLGAFIVLALLFLIAAGIEETLDKYIDNSALIPFAVAALYLIVELAIRILIGPSTFANYAYYTLPISKISYSLQSLLLCLFNLFNIAALLFLGFYMIFSSVEDTYVTSLLSFYFAVLVSNNFLAFAIKRWYYLLVFLVLALSAPLFLGIDNLVIADWLITNAKFIWLVVPISIVLSGVTIYYTFSQEVHKTRIKTNYTFRFNLNLKDPLIWQEVLLIMRNKRPRGLILSYFLLIPYFYYIFYDQIQNPESNIILMSFILLILVAGLPLQYGYLGLAWEGKHLELLLTLSNFRKMIESKYRLLSYLTAASFVIILGIAVLIPQFLPMVVACLFLQLSAGNYMLIYYMIYNSKPIDINKSSFFNYQGISAAQMFIPLVIIAVQFLVLSIIVSIMGIFVGSAIVIAFSLGALFYKKQALDYIYRAWSKKKYYLLNNYRQP